VFSGLARAAYDDAHGDLEKWLRIEAEEAEDPKERWLQKVEAGEQGNLAQRMSEGTREAPRTTQEKMHRILLAAHEEFQRKGVNSFSYKLWRDWPLFYLKNRDEFDSMIAFLEQKGDIDTKRSQTFDGDVDFELTVAGIEHCEQLVEGISSPKKDSAAMTRKNEVLRLVSEFRSISFERVSMDDGDSQTAATVNYRHLLLSLQRLASPLLPKSLAKRLGAIEVDVQNIYSLFEAHAELTPLLYDVEEALEAADGVNVSSLSEESLIDPDLIAKLDRAPAKNDHVEFLSRMCQEINSCYSQGHTLATLLLMRALMNYVPPLFCHRTFADVAAQSPLSVKKQFGNLQEGLRSIANYQTHRVMKPGDCYPSRGQVEPFRAAFELLIEQVIQKLYAADGASERL
jgi:hypothetical protein